VNLTVANVRPLFSGSQFEIANDVIMLTDTDYLVDMNTTYTAGTDIEISTENIITCTVTNEDPTVTNVLALLYDSHFETVSDDVDPTEISLKNFDNQGKFDYDFLKQPPLKNAHSVENIQEPTFTGDVNIQEPITTLLSSSAQIFGIDYKYISFVNTGESNQTQYTMNFPEDTECDILVVGGGGAGCWRRGGGWWFSLWNRVNIKWRLHYSSWNWWIVRC